MFNFYRGLVETKFHRGLCFVFGFSEQFVLEFKRRREGEGVIRLMGATGAKEIDFISSILDGIVFIRAIRFSLIPRSICSLDLSFLVIRSLDLQPNPVHCGPFLPILVDSNTPPSFSLYRIIIHTNYLVKPLLSPKPFPLIGVEVKTFLLPPLSFRPCPPLFLCDDYTTFVLDRPTITCVFNIDIIAHASHQHPTFRHNHRNQ